MVCTGCVHTFECAVIIRSRKKVCVFKSGFLKTITHHMQSFLLLNLCTVYIKFAVIMRSIHLIKGLYISNIRPSSSLTLMLIRDGGAIILMNRRQNSRTHILFLIDWNWIKECKKNTIILINSFTPMGV